MKDKIIICIQCDADFTFTIREQERFFEMGFDEPRRCPQCRKHRTKNEEGEERTKHRNKKNSHRKRYADDVEVDV